MDEARRINPTLLHRARNALDRAIGDIEYAAHESAVGEQDWADSSTQIEEIRAIIGEIDALLSANNEKEHGT